MLTPGDDYPLHQTADPIAFSGTDRNFYDRFFFNGYDSEHDLFFAVALGVYPQLNIMDASFCVLHQGQQINLRASKEMNMDRLNLTVGPITISLVRPLLETRIIIDAPDYDLAADLTAIARHQAIEEPRFTRRQGPRAFMDYTRATQNVSWRGEVTARGHRLQVQAAHCCGTRDRSWGVRPVGMGDPQTIVPPLEPQFYWLWTPSNFEQHSLFCHSNDDGDGDPWNRRAVLVDHQTDTASHFDEVILTPTYAPQSRRITELTGVLVGADELSFTMRCGPIFYMQGLGYGHPEWGHGRHHGPLRVACDSCDEASAEVQLRGGDFLPLHIQALAHVELSGRNFSTTGHCVVEQLFLGRHAPSEFSGLLDRIVP